MAFLSVTRLRLRSIRFLPGFALFTSRSLSQVRAAPGLAGGALQVDFGLTFWTLTAWDTAESMRRYMTTGSHKLAMPKLLHWCDEGSVVHWEQEQPVLPGWDEAEQRMRTEGRASKVLRPSPHHADLSFAPRRPWATGPIAPTPRS